MKHQRLYTNYLLALRNRLILFGGSRKDETRVKTVGHKTNQNRIARSFRIITVHNVRLL